jgi:hypothetical protein
VSKDKNLYMKKAFALIVFLGIVIVSEVKAQETPVVDGRQRAQRARIREGAASGDLTRGETAKLRSQQRHIRRTERRAKADGEVTRDERAKIKRKQNRANRNIRREKHDVQERPN